MSFEAGRFPFWRRMSGLIASIVSCTDASWLDSSCPQYCKDDTSTVYGDLRQCDDSDTNWVCGVDQSNCNNSFQVAVGYVDDNRDQTLSAILALPSVYTASAAAATSGSGLSSGTVTKTVTPTATSSSSAKSPQSTESNNATTIGLGTGLGIGLPLLSALCVSLFLLWRAQKKIQALQSGHQVARSELQDHAHPDPVKWQPKHEMDTQYVYEVPGSRP